MSEHSPQCPYGAAAVGVGGGSSGEDCKYSSSLLRRPAFLLTVSETAGLNMVFTRQWAYSKKSVLTQMEGLPRNVAVQVSAVRPSGVPEPVAAWGGWQGFHMCEV